MQQTLLADWRKSRKLQELDQSLSLLVDLLVGRDPLRRETTFSQTVSPAEGSVPDDRVLDYPESDLHSEDQTVFALEPHLLGKFFVSVHIRDVAFVHQPETKHID